MGMKKKELAKNLHKGQLDSRVLALRPNNKEAVSPYIGRGLGSSCAGAVRITNVLNLNTTGIQA